MERKMQQLSNTSSLLTHKVTGVNFYLKDLSTTGKFKPTPFQTGALSTQNSQQQHSVGKSKQS
jgi:hypothetical protein